MVKFEDRHKVVPIVYILFREGNQVLLLLRANTGYRDNEYGMPAGHIEARESASQAAIREAKEEVGVDITPKDLKLVHTMYRHSTNPKIHERVELYFEPKKWHGQLMNAEPHKCAEIRWFDTNKLPENIVPELKFALSMIRQGKNFSDYDF